MLSFIVPAHNEALELPRTLAALRAAASGLGERYEIIVVNDASADATATAAIQAGARVIDVKLRKISAVRNAGARAAQGDRLFFVDADTEVSAELLSSAVRALNEGAIGGGARVRFAEPISLWLRFCLWVFSVFYFEWEGWAAGCFLFVTRSAFDAVGGFNENYYATEEVILSMALKKKGRFVIVPGTVVTSNRKMRTHSAWSIVPLTLRFLRYGTGVFRRPQGLDWWYDGKR